MKTKDGLELLVRHKPEAENDFVVLERVCPDHTMMAHLQPDEAVWLATDLLRYARIAREANERYMAGKGN